MSLKYKLKIFITLMIPFILIWYALTAVIITNSENLTFTLNDWLDNMFNWEHFLAYILGMSFVLGSIAMFNYFFKKLKK
jgi:uncharacterized protein involved in cysteine biosynthesis